MKISTENVNINSKTPHQNSKHLINTKHTNLQADTALIQTGLGILMPFSCEGGLCLP